MSRYQRVTIATRVIHAEDQHDTGQTRLRYECGHEGYVPLEDETAMSFVGSVTGCSEHTVWEVPA